MEEKKSQARALLDKTNRQFNECNALYHAAAQRCGLSDAAFWVLYALCTTHEPQTQNRMAAEWGQPKQTLNSAVAAMVKRRTQRQARDPDGRGACPGRAHGGAGYRSRAAGHDPSGPCRGRAELPPDPAVSGMLTAGV